MQERRSGGEGFYIRRFPGLTRVVNSIDRRVEELGFQAGLRDSLRTAEAGPTVINYTQEIDEIARNRPAIVIANHETITEALAIPAVLPPRKDTFMVMSQSFLSLFPHLDQHTLPIYLVNRMRNDKIIKRILIKALTYGGIDYEDAHRRNIDTINVAAQRISEGELGIIFPAPPVVSKNGEWKSGLGYLINGLTNASDVHIIEAYVEGTTHRDILRSVPRMRSKFPGITVTFRDPINTQAVKDAHPDASARQLVENMEVDYRAWVASLRS